MTIKSTPIKEYIEVVIGKFYEDITSDDLLNVKSLNISQVGFGGSIEKIYIEDLKLLPNIEELSLSNITIDDTINELKHLKSLKLTSCYLDKFFNFNLEELYLNDCEINNINSIKNIKGIKKLSLINMFIDLKCIADYKLDYLNLNNSIVNNMDYILKQKDLKILKIENIYYELKKLNCLKLEKVYSDEFAEDLNFKLCNEIEDVLEYE